MTPREKFPDSNKPGITFTIGGRSRTIRGRVWLPSNAAVTLASPFVIKAGEVAHIIPAGPTPWLTYGLAAGGILTLGCVRFGK